jgi:hypothetical protein
MRWVLLTLLITACAQKTPDQKLAADIGTATSWVATFEFTCDRWLSNRVPSSFVRDALKPGVKALEKAEEKVDQSKADQRLRATVRQSLQSAHAAAADVRRALDRGDRDAVAQARSRFATAYAALHEAEEANR